ncbi:MAG: sensor histidine kinase [Gemmatimonadales bacterium]|nr:MAG: sensor histidine kinase [Gemmatimonadales bacterium]
MSLRRKFALALVLFTIVLTFGGSVLAWRVMSRSLEAEMDEKLVWIAGAAVEIYLEGDQLVFFQRGDESSPFWTSHQRRLEGLKTFVEEAYVFRRSGTLGGQAMVTSEPADVIPIGTVLSFLDAYPQELAQAWEEGSAVTPTFEGPGGQPYKYGFYRLQDSNAMLAVLVQADFLDPLTDLRQTLILGALAATILAGILAYLLATNIVRPLERLSRAAIRIQRGRWDTPVSEERGDEVGRLSRAMERMRIGVVQRDEQLRLMLAQVAHEIRNPLGGLELFASAAMESHSGEERARLLTRIRTEIEALNGIINDFLAFARPLDPQVRVHDIRGPLTEAAELLDLELAGEGGSLEMNLADRPLMARADPDHVKRVILNLLKNAAEAGSNVWLTAWWWNGEVVVSVLDDGPGVAAEERDRIFEPFVTDKEQGAGLGLAIVKRVVESNGGRVELIDPDGTAEPGTPQTGPTVPSSGSGAEFRVYFAGSEDLFMDPEDD